MRRGSLPRNKNRATFLGRYASLIIGAEPRAGRIRPGSGRSPSAPLGLSAWTGRVGHEVPARLGGCSGAPRRCTLLPGTDGLDLKSGPRPEPSSREGLEPRDGDHIPSPREGLEPRDVRHWHRQQPCTGGQMRRGKRPNHNDTSTVPRIYASLNRRAKPRAIPIRPEPGRVTSAPVGPSVRAGRVGHKVPVRLGTCDGKTRRCTLLLGTYGPDLKTGPHPEPSPREDPRGPGTCGSLGAASGPTPGGLMDTRGGRLSANVHASILADIEPDLTKPRATRCRR